MSNFTIVPMFLVPNFAEGAEGCETVCGECLTREDQTEGDANPYGDSTCHRCEQDGMIVHEDEDGDEDEDGISDYRRAGMMEW